MLWWCVNVKLDFNFLVLVHFFLSLQLSIRTLDLANPPSM